MRRGVMEDDEPQSAWEDRERWDLKFGFWTLIATNLPTTVRILLVVIVLGTE